MNDVIYVAVTIAFFALMIGYVVACGRIGQTHANEETDHDTR
jgi:hypothetical protein